MQVLIVDDDDFALSMLDNILVRMGYTVIAARHGAEALEILRKGEIRLVVTDWDMPEMTGVDLCRAIRKEDLSGYVYVIMLTGREGAKQRLEGLCAGADDFLNKPLDPEELLVCLKTAERILSLETRDVALFALAKLAESRDSEAGSHIERVQSYTRLIAKHLSAEVKACYGVDAEYIRLLYQTSPLHDLGKVGIPDIVLLKPGRLTTDEFEIMKTHTLVGAETLDAALRRFPNARFLQIAREIAASHHEKFDGSGYPQGLAGEQIPLSGRIVAVADVYDALTSRRVYKDAMTHEQAKAIIIKDKGSHFDPEVVAAFLRAEEQIVSVWERLRDDFVTTTPEEPLPALPEPTTGSAGTCDILVAEDDPLLLKKLSEVLAVTGERVHAVSDGEQAMQYLRQHSPRLIVSDWVMPKVDGVDLCKFVRSRNGPESTHFIMLTGHSDKSRLLEAYAAGVDDFVSKPFDVEELLARVRAGIRSAKLHDGLVRKATGSQALNAHLATVNSRLERLCITDELTGLFNRRHALVRLEEQWAMIERYPRPLSIAMVDVDHFKEINDTLGHDAGDAILRRVSGILREQTRGTDAVCRFGGDEFLIIFPAQTLSEAEVCAERCRAAVAEAIFSVAGSTVSASISVGVAARTPQMTQCSDFLKAADEALYAAKRAGRPAKRAGGSDSDHFLGDTPMEPTTGACINSAPAAASTAAAREAAPIDMHAVLHRCGGDHEFAAAVTERFRSQAMHEVDKIEQALLKDDAGEVSRTAHALKSMAAYMSADAVASIARNLEELGRQTSLGEVPGLLAVIRAEIRRANDYITQKGGPAALLCNN
jgi:putative two-component system response regulator